MLKYITINGTQYPASFGNAAFMEYEDLTGKSAFGDFLDALPNDPITGAFDLRRLRLGFFARITFCALKVGGNIARTPLTASLDEIANGVTMEVLPEIIDSIAAAMPKATSDDEANQGEAKGTTPRTTATGGK